MEEWIQAFTSLVFIVVQVWLDLKLPDYMSGITKLLQTPENKMSDIWLAGGKKMLCALGSFVSAAVVGFFVQRIADNNTYERLVTVHLLNWSLSY